MYNGQWCEKGEARRDKRGLLIYLKEMGKNKNHKCIAAIFFFLIDINMLTFKLGMNLFMY